MGEDWTVNTTFENDVLSISGENGLLLFDEDFEDFELETEFLLSNNNTSGIAFRYSEAKKGNPKYAGYLVNLDHNLDQQNPTGSIYNVARAKWLKSTKTDSWNKVSIEAKGDHLWIFINDTIVTETHNRRSDKGHIGILVNSSNCIF